MGGVLTKKHDNSRVLAHCRERKRLLKLAVENRDAFAVAQCKYNNSLLTLSKAMRLFVAKHSASASHSSQNNDKNTPFPQQKPKRPTNFTVDPCPNPDPADSLASSEVTEESQKQEENTRVDRKQKGIVVEDDGSEEGDNSDDDEAASEQFYDKMVPEMPSTEGETTHGWDFFDPYAHAVSDLGVHSEYCVRKFREFEGIPDLEHGMEEVLMYGEKFESVHKSVVGHGKSEVSHVAVEVGSNESLGECSKGLVAKEKPQIYKSVGGVKIGKDKNENVGEKTDLENESEVSDDEVKMEEEEEEEGEENVCSDETKDLTVIETRNNGKDLLKAFEEIEDLFHTAYEAGLDVSKMLEASRFQLQTGLTENSSNIFWSIVRNPPSLNRCSSCKSVLPSPPLTTITSSRGGTEIPMHMLFDEYPGMQSGSHSLSIAKLYQWERKLYQDVKTGENNRKRFERECVVLRKKQERGQGFHFADKTRLKVKALHARIWVAVECAQAISKRIVKVRDEEIEPQLFELLGGLMKMWKTISQSHETQSRIMFEVATFNSSDGNYCSHFHRHATIELEAELKKWRACFSEYIAAQKAYIESLDAWFSVCSGPEPEEAEEDSEEIPSAPEFRIHGPPVISVCHEWLASMAKLPDEEVMNSLKSFGKNVKALSVQQWKEQKQKKKVDLLVREFDRKVSALRREENKILKLKESQREVDRDFQHRMERLEERKMSLEEIRHKIELEKAKHMSGMEETHRATLAGFQTGFSAVLESLVDFSKATVKMYDDLSTCIENAKAAAEDNGTSN